MKYLVYFLAILFLLALNVGFFPFFKFHSTIPNLLFLLVIIFSLDKGNFDFFFISMVAGLYLDFFLAAFPGTFTFPLLTLALLLNLTAKNIVMFEINWKYLGAVLVFSEIIFALLVWLYSSAVLKIGWADTKIELQFLESRFFPQLVYDLLLLYPVYVFSSLLKSFLADWQNRRRRVI